MACDMFSSENARELLRGRFIYFFGDSNTRALYKDLVWLLENEKLISETTLKTKNEESFAGDVRLSSGQLHNGRDYTEVREYKKSIHMKFEFITRLYLPKFINTINNLKNHPDVLVLNSCVWDLTRWGADGVQQFKTNVMETLILLKSHLTNTRIIWLTTLPPAFKSRGGFLTEEIEFMRNMLPWHIVCANKYVSDLAVFLKIDVLDLHYHFRFLMDHHTKDGIHWNPKTMRYATNLLLTHISLIWNRKLPCKYFLDKEFISHSQVEHETSSTQNHLVLSEASDNIKQTKNVFPKNNGKRNEGVLLQPLKAKAKRNRKRKNKKFALQSKQYLNNCVSHINVHYT